MLWNSCKKTEKSNILFYCYFWVEMKHSQFGTCPVSVCQPYVVRATDAVYCLSVCIWRSVECGLATSCCCYLCTLC